MLPGASKINKMTDGTEPLKLTALATSRKEVEIDCSLENQTTISEERIRQQYQEGMNKFIAQQEPTASGTFKMNRSPDKDSTPKEDSSSVHFMSEAVGTLKQPTVREPVMANNVKHAASPSSTSLDVEKAESLPSTKPPAFMSEYFQGHPKRFRIRKASCGCHQLNDKPLKKIGKLHDDHEDLLNAALSIHSAHEQASDPFWKKMEPFFAPITPEDLLFLKLAKLHSAEELNRSHSKDVLKRDCSSEGEENSLGQQSAYSFEGLGIAKMSSTVPSLFQRVLSALIVEDEGKGLYHHDEGRSVPLHSMSVPCLSGSSDVTDCDFKDKERVESEIESKLDLQLQMSFMADNNSCSKSASSNTNSKESMSSFFSGNEHSQSDDGLLYSDKGFPNANEENDTELPNVNDENDAGSVYSSQVNMPLVTSFNCQCQMLSQDDRLFQELHYIGLWPETMPHSEDEEWVDQEIKKLEEKRYQQVSEAKKYLEKMDKAIQSGQDLERRITEEFAVDKLTTMAYERIMGGRRAGPKLRKKASSALIERTLARCKEFEDTGRTCFSQPNLQRILFSAHSPGKDAVPVPCNGLTIGNSKCSEMHSKVASRGSIEGHNTSSGKLHFGFSGSQQALTHCSKRKRIINRQSRHKDEGVMRDREPKQKKVTRNSASVTSNLLEISLGTDNIIKTSMEKFSAQPTADKPDDPMVNFNHKLNKVEEFASPATVSENVSKEAGLLALHKDMP